MGKPHLVRLALVANTAAGSGVDLARVLFGLRERGAKVTVLTIEHVEHAPSTRPDRIVVAGGDGSIGAVAGVAIEAGVPLAVLPVGTANDFAGALHIPTDLDAALDLATDPDARTREIDVAHADDRLLLNTASWGLAVDAAEAATPLKGVLGGLSYGVAAVKAGLTADHVVVRVVVDGAEVFEGPAWQVIVAGTGAFGGGSGLEAADPGDGMLDVAVVPDGARVRLVRVAAAMRAGDLHDLRDVAHARGREIEVEVRGGRDAANVDGEIVEPAPRRIAIAAGRLTVIVP